ncbi:MULTISPECIES: FeoA family protein [Gulbenkiania]|uniref:Fe2+ transport system protein FeoA n=2 Tax=Gulbenkiania TaxID=397456 RepID=A0A0K6GUH7_9NEIS|nr:MULTISPECIES: FeoA family protein [Gulbenkiania]TCW33791.1 ferrous iron transport protein A [Gulbenkiania mobilis]CUA82162.1 Fe2+ transport system protein FeoA [Gulbenkiania indica]
MTLDLLGPGAMARVVCLHLDDTTRRRVAAFGLLENADLRLMRRAAFGGPLVLAIGTTQFLLRQSLARQIEVEVRS